MTTLVIGARGSVGREVLDQLVAAGEPVRASVRDPAAAAALPAGVPVIAADLTKPETLRPALDGVDRAFLYAPAGGIDDFLEAARDAGLGHIVLLSSGSVLLPSAVGNMITEEHRGIERSLADSGLPWTPIRPLVLANNASRWAYSARTERIVRLFHPDSLTAPIHERDIAAVAVAALIGEAGEQAAEMLTGSTLISQRRQVELIGAAIDRELQVEELTEAEARERFGHGEKPETVDAVLKFIASTANGGSPATDTIERVLGRPALPFEQWASDHAADFR
jgi:uncharacterized protein YbjT (DUF2867 family)